MITIKEVYNEAETYSIAKNLAKACKGGEVFCLDGDLGVGKTVFSKGFANGLGIKSMITSPTFAIVCTYDESEYTFNHFDVYRMNDIDELEDIGFSEYFDDKNSVTLIEWGGLFKNYLPYNTVFILIEKDLSKGEDYRKITISN